MPEVTQACNVHVDVAANYRREAARCLRHPNPSIEAAEHLLNLADAEDECERQLRRATALELRWELAS